MIEIDWEEVGRLINQAMLMKGVGSEFVAHKAGVDRRTVDRLRKGAKIRIQNLVAIETVLELSVLRDHVATDAAVKALTATPRLGGYTLESCENYIGAYHLFRRSYDYPDRVVCALLKIFWDYDRNCLRFEENQRNRTPEGKEFRYNFVGDISIPLGLGCAQFIGRFEKGFNRIMTCTSLRGDEVLYFKGILVGLNALSDVAYYPVSTPVYIEKIEDDAQADVESGKIGSFERAQLWHKTADAELTSVSDKFIS